MCNKAVSEDPFMLKSCHDRFKTNKADDDFPSAIKFVPDWFVTSKITKKVQSALFGDDHVLFFDENSGNVTFSIYEIDIVSMDLNNIDLDDVNFDGNNPENIIHVRLMAWHNNLNNTKHIKKI